MFCDRCGSNPIDIMDTAGVGLCLRCYAVVLDEREAVGEAGGEAGDRNG